MIRRSAVKGLLALLATVAFIAIVRRTIDLSALTDHLQSSDPRWIAAGIGCVIATTCLRATRLCLILKGDLDAGLFSASVMHNASTALLPMKLGEFALPLLLSRLGHAGLSAGLGILLLLRALDMMVLAVVGSFACALALGNVGHRASGTVWVVFTACAVAGLALSACWNWLSPMIHDSRLLRVSPKPLRDMVSAATQVPTKRLAHAGLLSVLIWVALFAAFYCLSNAVGTHVDVWQAAAIGAVASFAFAFPVSGLANVGPFQAAWVWMATVLGLSATPALAASLAAHGMVVAITSVLALSMSPCLVARMRTAKKPFSA